MEKNKVVFRAGVYVNNSLWFASEIGNALLCHDGNTTKYMGSFLEEYENKPLFKEVVVYEGKLFFIPLWAKNIAVYDLQTKQFSYLPWMVAKELSKRSVTSVLWGNFLYIFLLEHTAIIKVDLDTYEMKLIGIYREGKEQIIQNRIFQEQCLAAEGNIYQNKMYVLLANTNEILKINLENDSYEFEKIGMQEEPFFAMTKKDSRMLLFSKETVVKWNIETKKVQIYKKLPSQHQPSNYLETFLDGDNYWFVSSFKKIIKMNVFTGEAEEVFEIPKGDVIKNILICFRKIENKVWLCTNNLETFVLDVSKKHVEKKMLELPEEVKENYIRKVDEAILDRFKRKKYFLEGHSEFSLNVFIRNVEHLSKSKDRKCIGKDLWSFTK